MKGKKWRTSIKFSSNLVASYSVVAMSGWLPRLSFCKCRNHEGRTNWGVYQSQYREVVCSDVYLKRESETLTTLWLKFQKFRPKSIEYISIDVHWSGDRLPFLKGSYYGHKFFWLYPRTYKGSFLYP